jgi:hypothetical protein
MPASRFTVQRSRFVAGIPLMTTTSHSRGSNPMVKRSIEPGPTDSPHLRLSDNQRTTVLVFGAFLDCAPIASALLQRGRLVRAVRFGLDIVAAVQARGTDSVIIASGVEPSIAEAVALFAATERPGLTVLHAQERHWRTDPTVELRRLLQCLP